MPAPVLLTSGDTRSALAVARSLHARGLDVIALSQSRSGRYAHCTRAVREVVHAPAAGQDPAGFVDALQHSARRLGAGLIIPLCDDELLTLDRARKLFGDTPLAMASSAAINNVLDKRVNLALAASLGLPVPRQFDLVDLSQLPEAIAALGWPIVLKQPANQADPNAPRCDFRVLYAHNLTELLDHLDRHCAPGRYPILQGFVRGEAHNVVCMAVGGEAVALHQYRSIRTLAGCGVYRQAVACDPKLEQHARRMLAALRWDGVAHVGFFVERDTGRTGYMEVNGRFWASTQASVDAGWDFPWWVHQFFTAAERPRVPALRLDSRSVWRYGDLQSLTCYLKGGASPSPGTTPTRLGAIGQFLGGYVSGARSETFRWSDPGPGLLDARHAARDAVRGLARRLRPTPAPPVLAPAPPLRPATPAADAASLPAASTAPPPPADQRQQRG